MLFRSGLVIIPPVASNLGFVPMDQHHWLISLGLIILPTIVAEYGKFWDNYKYHEAERQRVIHQKI